PRRPPEPPCGLPTGCARQHPDAARLRLSARDRAARLFVPASPTRLVSPAPSVSAPGTVPPAPVGSTAGRPGPKISQSGTLPMSTKKTDSPEYEGDLATQERTRTEKPRRYVVVLHNDDYTTQEFVVQVLMAFFHKDVNEATHIMLQVHRRGWGGVGVFTRHVAETKAVQVMPCAHANGHPVRVTAASE